MNSHVELTGIVQQPTPSGMRWSCSVAVPASSGWFDGHFPNAPVLPGVAQLVLVQALLRHALGDSTSIAAIGRWKLRARVAPEARVQVTIEPTDAERGWRFTLDDPQGVAISSGVLTVNR